MKKYFISTITLLLIIISLNAQRTTESNALKSKAETNQRSTDSRQYLQKNEAKSNDGYPQYIFIVATENLSGKLINIEVTGDISFENVKIETTEDKEKILASMKATESFKKVESIANIFKVANNSFIFESHNIIRLEKELKHYILFSTN